MERKISKETLKSILKYENPKIKNLFVSDEKSKELDNSLYGFEEEKRVVNELYDIYHNLIDILKKYCDLREDYYNIISLWIIGTYFHHNFPSYPYLFLNATKGSGKTRLLKLITFMAKDGEMLNSLTEAVLFRSRGTLAIDEFEGLERKGKESLRELLNSAYKKGTKVKRMRKTFTKTGEDQVPETFDVYRPLVIANISGMESVLGDRCIPLIIEKSDKQEIVNLIEMFDAEKICIETKEILSKISVKNSNLVSLVSVSFLWGIYIGWNDFVSNNNTNNTLNTNNTNNINSTHLYERIKSIGIRSRELELALPFLIISNEIGDKSLLETTLSNVVKIFSDKREEDLVDNNDVSLLDFLSQLVESNDFIPIRDLTSQFKESVQTTEDWLNEKWMGRALKRLNIIKGSRRLSRGRDIIINFKKVKEKIRMFR